MTFRSLEITDWRQFEHILIDFHPKLTVLTGANGSGKTTLLNILGRHLNWNVNFVSTPRRRKGSANLQYDTGFSRRPQITSGSWVNIGNVVYENGTSGTLQVPGGDIGQQYGINILNMQAVPGLHIPSHRPVYSYQPVAYIPTQVMSRQQVYSEYFGSTFARYQGQNHNKAPNQLMKEVLISLALFGYGSEYVTPDGSARATFENFQEILRQVLPSTIGFERLSIQTPEVVLETKSGNFSLDAVSGGVASIIDMAWRIFMYSPENGQSVCTIDEPENHLHPALQQSLMSNFISAFPNTQFIIATHSPFMISAVYDSSVYVLDYNSDQRVEGAQLETVNKSGTANEILKDVLGLPFTIPLWAEEKFDYIVQKYADKGVSDETVDELEAELKAAGLEDFVPERREVLLEG